MDLDPMTVGFLIVVLICFGLLSLVFGLEDKLAGARDDLDDARAELKAAEQRENELVTLLDAARRNQLDQRTRPAPKPSGTVYGAPAQGWLADAERWANKRTPEQ